MRVVPDRRGHAASTEEQGSPIGNGPQAFAGEQYYTMTANDTLSSVAKKFGVTVAWLIKRNELSEFKKVGAGTNLIVPSSPIAKPATAKPAAKPAPAPARQK